MLKKSQAIFWFDDYYNRVYQNLCHLISYIVYTYMQEGAAPLADEAALVPRVSPEEIKEKVAIKSVFVVDTRSVSYIIYISVQLIQYTLHVQ